MNPKYWFLAGGGEMGQLMRSHNWEQTPLGSPESWPQSLRTIVNVLLTSRYAMWVGWGETLVFLYNDAYRPTLGFKHPQSLGKPASEVWAEIWREIGTRIKTVLATGQATYDQGLLLFLERSGFPEETYHTFSYSPLADDQGTVCGMLCVVTEETERVITERRMTTLRELAARLTSSNTASEVFAGFRRELERNPQDIPFSLFYMYDDNGDARLACSTNMPEEHDAAPRQIGAGSNTPWPANEIHLNPAAQLMPLGKDWNFGFLPFGAWDKPPQQVVVVPIPYQGHERPAGFLVLGINPYLRYGDAYAGFVDLIAGQLAAGLSNARAYEQERHRAEALAELDRAKTAFFSNVSHEFRTPLTLMLSPIEDLLSRAEFQDHRENRELLEVVQRSGLRLQKLVNTLLDFSRLEAGRAQARYQATDLAALTTELASSFRSAMDRAGLQYIVDCPKLSEPVFVDPEMWEKIVLNLVSNAFKYTLEGMIVVRLIEREETVEFSVSDTGVGIPEEELPKLFERFHRVERTRGRTHEGTGIGLALVRELVKLHDGSVSVRSELDRGSTFTVSVEKGIGHLPQERLGANRNAVATPGHTSNYVEEAMRWLPDQRAGSQVAPAPLREETPFKTRKSERVLLADDNADMREYIRRLLAADYEVTTLANGEEALLAALASPPDLILSDVMMPIRDGFSLLNALRQHPQTQGIPVILLSARAGEEARVEGIESGADDYLVKPFSARELLARIGATLALRKERQRSQERLSQIFMQAPVGIVLLRGRDLVVELANPTYRNVLQGRELIGRRIFDVVPELGQNVKDAFQLVFDTGEPLVANDFHFVYDQDGDGVAEDHWFNVVYHPLRESDAAVSGIIAVVNDVTAQMLARVALERANRELEEFAYVSSHDLQEPLRMVSIYSELLLSEFPTDNEAIRAYGNYVRDGVRRVEQLIKDLLVYSRIVHPEQDELQVADLNQSLCDAMSVLKVRIEESRAQISTKPLPSVWGEERQLALVFQNLLSNAIKYCMPGMAPRIEIAAEERPGQWVISVKDSGIGFHPVHAERIFGLFKRLHKESYPGTGLGLAICKRIVERFDGQIWASSEGEGFGATVYFSLKRPDSFPR